MRSVATIDSLPNYNNTYYLVIVTQLLNLQFRIQPSFQFKIHVEFVSTVFPVGMVTMIA